MRLGGWQRIGVVLSVVWAALVAAYALYEMHRGPFSQGILTKILESGSPEVREGYTLIPVDVHLLWGRLAAFTLGPVIAAWAAFYGGSWLLRWVATGFNRHDT